VQLFVWFCTSLGTRVFSYGLCVNMLRLEELYELLELSMMAELTQGTIISVI